MDAVDEEGAVTHEMCTNKRIWTHPSPLPDILLIQIYLETMVSASLE